MEIPAGARLNINLYDVNIGEKDEFNFRISIHGTFTGKSLSEAFIFVSTNPQYDDRLYIELRVQYMNIASSEHGENMLCTHFFLVFFFDIQINLCTQHDLPMWLR